MDRKVLEKTVLLTVCRDLKLFKKIFNKVAENLALDFKILLDEVARGVDIRNYMVDLLLSYDDEETTKYSGYIYLNGEVGVIHFHESGLLRERRDLMQVSANIYDVLNAIVNKSIKDETEITEDYITNFVGGMNKYVNR